MLLSLCDLNSMHDFWGKSETVMARGAERMQDHLAYLMLAHPLVCYYEGWLMQNKYVALHYHIQYIWGIWFWPTLVTFDFY